GGRSPGRRSAEGRGPFGKVPPVSSRNKDRNHCREAGGRASPPASGGRVDACSGFRGCVGGKRHRRLGRGAGDRPGRPLCAGTPEEGGSPGAGGGGGRPRLGGGGGHGPGADGARLRRGPW